VISRQNADIADTLHLRDVATATILLAFYIWGAYWCHLANTTEPSMCGCDSALCQITLTTCYTYGQRPRTSQHNTSNSFYEHICLSVFSSLWVSQITSTAVRFLDLL